MRGADGKDPTLFSYVPLENRIAPNHPARAIRKMADVALKEISPLLDSIYATTGRPSIPPEQLLRATLLQILFSVRSERMLVEQIHLNMLYLWFVGLRLDDKVWDHSVFSKNRDRLLDGEVAQRFLKAVLDQASSKGLLSDEHFSVDGTLVQAWASVKSLTRKDGDNQPPSSSGRNSDVDFKGEALSNESHSSKTDPESMLARRGTGKEAKLSFLGHALMENRNGLILDTRMTRATGTAETEAAIDMLEYVATDKPLTVAGDKGYDRRSFVSKARELKITPHVAKKKLHSAIDGRTTRHESYKTSQRIRKRIEEFFGWAKTIGPMRRPMFHGTQKLGWLMTMTAATYNLLRMQRLMLCTT